jgi:hypothetical protein
MYASFGNSFTDLVSPTLKTFGDDLGAATLFKTKLRMLVEISAPLHQLGRDLLGLSSEIY